MNRANRIQQLLVKHLLENGHIELLLPDGMVLEVGTVQEDEKGNMKKVDDYCWILATQKNRTIGMDSYNLDLRYEEESDKILLEETVLDNGKLVRVLQAV